VCVYFTSLHKKKKNVQVNALTCSESSNNNNNNNKRCLLARSRNYKTLTHMHKHTNIKKKKGLRRTMKGTTCVRGGEKGRDGWALIMGTRNLSSWHTGNSRRNIWMRLTRECRGDGSFIVVVVCVCVFRGAKGRAGDERGKYRIGVEKAGGSCRHGTGK
jgi:hypothetical protein